MTENKIVHILKGDDAFPRRFSNYANMPEELYLIGSMPDPAKKTVAIVGARVCTAYGRIQAFQFAKELSRNGVQIISGLAAGIDTEGHKGALEGGTPTYAVLGSGVDICYPSSNRVVYERIVRKGGGIISEYPPGSPPLAYHFPIRNRIISALADLVLVMEARARSGSLITANYALDQGKPVYALPGAIHEKLSEGTNQLIFDGAGLALSPEVILTELGVISRKETDCIESASKPASDALSGKILACLSTTPVTMNEIMRQTGLSLREVTEVMIPLQLSGRIEEITKGNFTIGRKS